MLSESLVCVDSCASGGKQFKSDRELSVLGTNDWTVGWRKQQGLGKPFEYRAVRSVGGMGSAGGPGKKSITSSR